MSTAETKTYSGQKAYHEMLVAAQALCPALTYLMCKLLLGCKIEGKQLAVSTEVIHINQDAFSPYFHREPRYCRMSLFLEAIFHRHTVRTNWVSSDAERQKIWADVQFVRWLQSGVVVLNDEDMLATITL